jgi:HK97 family phage portal protein
VQIGPFTIARTKALPLQPLSGRAGWWSIIRESFTGAWQRNEDVRMDTVLTYFAVFACVTLIASDIAKLCLRLVQKDADGIWTETESPAFSPVLRKPNRYQTIIKFVEQWIVSKLVHGNTYVLKQRDNRGIVVALYVLDPTRVTPLVAADGSVYYELKRDDLSGLTAEVITVPAREIIHDTMVALYHPLIGVSPIYACGLAAMQGLSIQSNSNKFFSNGSNPGGVLTAPGAISDETAARLKAYWDANYTGDNVGKVAVLGDGLKYEGMAVNAVDAQLIEQLKWTAETVCSCFHVPAYMVGVGPPPPYANIEPLLQQYYSQCIQSLLNSFECCLDEGLELPKPYGTEFDIGDLIWMDTATKTKAAGDSIGSAAMSPNEARKTYLGLGPIPGGASAYLQQQYYSLEALAARDQDDPFAKPEPQPVPELPPADTTTPMDRAASFKAAVRRKGVERGLLRVA